MPLTTTTTTYETDECRICDGRNFEPIIDLGHHPLADRFPTKRMLASEPEIAWPLRVHLCADCGYAGLHVTVDVMTRYQAADYSYTAGNSPVSVKHFAELAAAIVARCGVPGFAVDIGGNDGTLLAAIRAESAAADIGRKSETRVLNIEPSGPMLRLSLERGIAGAGVFWACGLGAATLVGTGKVDLFTATNVMNHAMNPNLFVREVATGLRDGGWFVFEVPSFHELVRQLAFDTIYLEHASYFGSRSLTRLLNQHGLTIEHVETIPYMGGSLRVFARKRVYGAVESGWPAERDEGVNNIGNIYHAHNYPVMMTMIRRARARLLEHVHEIRAAGAEVFAIGAAAKGNTLLNYCGFKPHDISCVLDTSPHKIGKYTPGSHIPIVDDDGLPEQVKLGAANPYKGQGIGGARNSAIILPWNIATHLTSKYAHLNINFITPIVG